jgi:hypothetical protein
MSVVGRAVVHGGRVNGLTTPPRTATVRPLTSLSREADDEGCSGARGRSARSAAPGDDPSRGRYIDLPGGGERAYDVRGMTPGAEYVVLARGSRPQRVRADAGGTLRFTAALDVRVRRLG